MILNLDVRARITKNAHNDLGHHGRDPTYQKVWDSYWWPNQYVFIGTYCRSCHKCQMRLTYHNTIPLQLQYMQMILWHFGVDSMHMPMGKGGQRYIVNLVDNLTGWVEAQALRKLKASNIADFLFDMMCPYFNSPEITVPSLRGQQKS